jgi:hypothetical protein
MSSTPSFLGWVDVRRAGSVVVPNVRRWPAMVALAAVQLEDLALRVAQALEVVPVALPRW